MLKGFVLAVTSFIAFQSAYASTPITPDQAERIHTLAETVQLQSRYRATIQEAIKALGAPDYVVDQRNMKAAGRSQDASYAHLLMAWDHEGCIISYLMFGKDGRANGAEATASVMSRDNYQRFYCPDYSHPDETQKLSKFSCQKSPSHKYCKTPNNKRENVRDTTINTKSPQRINKVKSQFSEWDGSHNKLEAYIKANMNDPGSYKHVETRYQDKGEYILVTTMFRGKNAFGAVVLNRALAKIDISGNILTFDMQ